MTVIQLIAHLRTFPQMTQVVIENGGEAVSWLFDDVSARLNEYGVVVLEPSPKADEVEADGRARIVGRIMERRAGVKARNS